MTDADDREVKRDWRNADEYRDLYRLERRDFAREYVKRNEEFRRQDRRAAVHIERLPSGVLVVHSPPDAALAAWGVRFRGA